MFSIHLRLPSLGVFFLYPKPQNLSYKSKPATCRLMALASFHAFHVLMAPEGVFSMLSVVSPTTSTPTASVMSKTSLLTLILGGSFNLFLPYELYLTAL